MGDHELCKEYVLTDVGSIFYGNEQQISAKPWNYGQVLPNHIAAAFVDLWLSFII